MIRMTQEEYTEIARTAKRAGVSMSEIVRFRCFEVTR